MAANDASAIGKTPKHVCVLVLSRPSQWSVGRTSVLDCTRVTPINALTFELAPS